MASVNKSHIPSSPQNNLIIHIQGFPTHLVEVVLNVTPPFQKKVKKSTRRDCAIKSVPLKPHIVAKICDKKHLYAGITLLKKYLLFYGKTTGSVVAKKKHCKFTELKVNL